MVNLNLDNVFKYTLFFLEVTPNSANISIDVPFQNPDVEFGYRRSKWRN